MVQFLMKNKEIGLLGIMQVLIFIVLAFGQWHKTSDMYVYAGVFLCGYIVKNQSLAEEITQNTFYKAMTAKRPYETKSGELTWLCSIAKNLSIDECRKNKKFSELDETLPQQTADLADKVSDTDSALQIHMVLHELPEPYKEVFQLRVFGELIFV